MVHKLTIMKKIILAVLVVVSLASCHCVNTYRVTCIDIPGHPYLTQIESANEYNVSQIVVENGHSYVIDGVQDIELTTK